jgi:long-chain acyl-CoA synthetase
MTAPAVWAFDLDGCLVGAVLATSLRPRARELLERLRAGGTTVVIWSAGGADYARRIAETVGIADLVDGYYSKTRGADGKWTLAGFPPEHRPTLCVDDEPASIPSDVAALAVPPYLGTNLHDCGLDPCFARDESRVANRP